VSGLRSLDWGKTKVDGVHSEPFSDRQGASPQLRKVETVIERFGSEGLTCVRGSR
jgi:hypothetical protein